VRLLIFSLVVVNVLFFAWAQWIDVPATASVAKPDLPALQLAPSASGSAPEGAPEGPPAGSVPTSSVPVSAAGPATPAPDAVAASGAMGGAPAGASCFSIGPYADAQSAARVAGVLQGRGLGAQQRMAPHAETSGFWDYIPPLKNAAEVSKARQALERAGIKDVDVLSQPEYAGRISVGLFDDKDHADKRAADVRALGYTVDVEARQRQGSEFWLDLSPAASAPAVALDDAALSNGATLQKTACPAPGAAPGPAA